MTLPRHRSQHLRMTRQVMLPLPLALIEGLSLCPLPPSHCALRFTMR
jgi:hypothetical protein